MDRCTFGAWQSGCGEIPNATICHQLTENQLLYIIILIIDL
jgi:hypothetical protein